MSTVLVTYAGDAGTRFDRDYYVQTHLPMVRDAWGPHGLESVAAFFPADAGAGTIAIAYCTFRDEAAIDAAFGAPQTMAVMADVKNYTDAAPVRSRAAQF